MCVCWNDLECFCSEIHCKKNSKIYSKKKTGSCGCQNFTVKNTVATFYVLKSFNARLAVDYPAYSMVICSDGQ